MKAVISRQKISYFITEYIIVVVGILSAFTLNAWWQSEQAADRQSAYLSRLAIEVQQANSQLERFVGNLKDNLAAVRHVNSSLAAGKIIDDNSELFARGLLLVDVLPAIRYPVPTYQELRNTGAFRELDNTTLKGLLSDIHMEYEVAGNQLAYFRSGLLDAKTSLNETVVYSAVNENDETLSVFMVEYDFDALHENVKLKNEMVEVVDTHEDWLFSVTRIYSLLEPLQKELRDHDIQALQASMNNDD